MTMDTYGHLFPPSDDADKRLAEAERAALQQTAEAARLYDAGWSPVKLAERFGVSADTVLIALRRAAVVIRPRGGGPPRRPAPR